MTFKVSDNQNGRSQVGPTVATAGILSNLGLNEVGTKCAFFYKKTCRIFETVRDRATVTFL